MQPPRHNHQVGKRQAFLEKPGLPTVRTDTVRTADRSVGGAFAPRPRERQTADTGNENNQVDRVISTGKLHTLPHFHTRPINVVVFHDSKGILVFRPVSRLDAFSGYPFRI